MRNQLIWHIAGTQNLGTDWDERVLPSIGNEIVKAVVARYNAEQLLTQRDKVSKAVSRPHCCPHAVLSRWNAAPAFWERPAENLLCGMAVGA